MWVAVGVAAVGLVMNVTAQQKAKKAGQQDAQFLAAQQQEAARKSRALGQRQSAEERKQARLVSSALQARAGGGGTDAGVIELEKDIAGEYRALSALYEGEEGALGLEGQAAAGLRSQRARSTAYNWQTAGTIVDSGSKMYGRYADPKPAKAA